MRVFTRAQLVWLLERYRERVVSNPEEFGTVQECEDYGEKVVSFLEEIAIDATPAVLAEEMDKVSVPHGAAVIIVTPRQKLTDKAREQLMEDLREAQQKTPAPILLAEDCDVDVLGVRYEKALQDMAKSIQELKELVSPKTAIV